MSGEKSASHQVLSVGPAAEHLSSAAGPVSSSWLGRVAYAEALALQESLVAQKIADPTVPDTLLLLEHDPVFTIGRTPDRSSLRDPAALPHPLITTGRGGQATFHGPGQLIGYPIFDLTPRGRDLHRFLRDLEAVLIAICGQCGVAARRREGLTGVWVREKKIASIGIGVRRWITFHGFALNVGGDLAPFRAITPCGLPDVEMTSLEQEIGRPLSVESIAKLLASFFASHFAAPLL